MLAVILIVLGYLIMSVVCVLFGGFTFDGSLKWTNFDVIQCFMGLLWPLFIPFFIIMWLMRLIAYPFRKEWW